MSGVNADRGINLIDPIWSVPGGDYVMALAWSADGRQLAAAHADGVIRVVASQSGEILRQWSGHAQGALALAWSPDGRSLASGGQDGLARLWDPTSGKELGAVGCGGAWVEHLAWSRKGDRLATAAGKSLRVWNERGERVFRFDTLTNTISALTWLRDGRQLATTGYGGVNLWQLGRNTPERRFDWKGSFLSLALSPNERQLAGGCQDASMVVWNVKTGKSVAMQGYPGKVTRLAWDASSRFLASAAASQLIVWDFSGAGPAGREPLAYDRHVDRIVDLRFHPKAPMLATVGDAGMLIVWALPHRGITEMAIGKQPFSVLAWSPLGDALAVGSADGEIYQFKIASASG